ncbi:MAG: nitroreductase family protein [Bacteroidetes bacterium]|jgi:nitroreductase|nr:nitroreductase family protein [Bacteroidota bacterium]MBT3748733.1 nitroreductase family protein [Bacteroidota bacterium]MBT4399253.1 nitroreductase family protein [Bacteroidota bacterium]MBT4409963.1 nitroreductase family protein [Bacteroidota bacterium]MBT5427938.1 nitroreductase family protein [Bacteroidota bacterium]
MINDLVKRNRSYRRFDESVRIKYENLLDWIDLARLSPSSKNQQALKFMPIVDEKECAMLFDQLAWAGYLADWDGPIVGERPVAYITILGDKKLGSKFETDMGIAAQSILLGAVDSGFGGCMIGSIKRTRVKEAFNISDDLSVLLVIALGKAAEKVVIEKCSENNIQYWRDKSGAHHVPKRSIEDLIIKT